MRHALFAVYGASGFEVPDPEGFEGAANYLRLTNVSLGFCGYGAKTIVDFPECDFARLQIALKGRATTILNGSRIALNTLQPCVVPPGQSISVVFEPGYEQLVLRIETAALEKALLTILGTKPRGALILDPFGQRLSPSPRSCAT